MIAIIIPTRHCERSEAISPLHGFIETEKRDCLVAKSAPFLEPKPGGRVDQAQRIHPANHRPRPFIGSLVGPRCLIHPTIAHRAHGSCAVLAAPTRAARKDDLGVARTTLFLVALLLWMISLNAFAENYPSKSIKIVVPYPAAGTPDILAREIAAKLTTAFGQQVIVDNRPGAGGNIGSDLVAKAAPDGYTIVMGTVATHSINQTLYKKLPFDPINDFAPIILVATTPNVLVVNPDLPVKTVKDLIALAKSKPGEITFSSGGNGTSHHLGGMLFQKLTGVQMTHVPYKGSGAALPDLIGGQVMIMFDNLPSSMPYIKSGKLRAVATTGLTRSTVLPDLPTVAETGVPGFEITAWFGLLAPAKTPRAIIDRLNLEVAKILNLPDIKARITAQGAELAPGTPQQLGQFIKDKTAQWAPIVKVSGAQID